MSALMITLGFIATVAAIASYIWSRPFDSCLATIQALHTFLLHQEP